MRAGRLSFFFSALTYVRRLPVFFLYFRILRQSRCRPVMWGNCYATCLPWLQFVHLANVCFSGRRVRSGAVRMGGSVRCVRFLSNGSIGYASCDHTNLVFIGPMRYTILVASIITQPVLGALFPSVPSRQNAESFTLVVFCIFGASLSRDEGVLDSHLRPFSLKQPLLFFTDFVCLLRINYSSAAS